MAGKPTRMSLVKQLLRMFHNGDGFKTIAKTLSMSKNTVKSYVTRVEESGVCIEHLLKLDDLVLEKTLLAGNLAYKDERYESLKEKLSYCELTKAGVTRMVLWDEYRTKFTPNYYCYSQFCDYLHQYRRSSKPSMVLDHNPGDKLYIDYAGKKLSYIDNETGEIIDTQVFVACLAYSDYCFSMAVPSQKTDDFIMALQCCLKDLGGVPRTLVPDNLKAAIVKASKYEPTVNKVLEDFANH